jgi:FHS family L-fucose permease-like MFS transporter|tara:strand:- start:412 stop:2037 length:1626 start_codon:yes stop_codon:yes gene_type:complete
MKKQATNYSALTILTTVFFFWGFIAAGNSIFIPFCKNYFSLDQFQSQLIDFAFYLAYFIGALGLFAVGSSKDKDIVGSWGYKKSTVYGLLFSALGAGAMIISVYLNTFTGMLLGLFVVALGFSLQQTSTNPFMIALGDPKTGSNRINLGGAVNSLGTTLGPLIIALALFGSAAAISDDMIASLSLSKVIILYGAVGVLFMLLAIIIGKSEKVPAGISNETPEKAQNALYTLIAMTVLLVACFVPVFNSYRFEFSALEMPGVEMNRMLWLAGGLAVIVLGILLAHFKSSKNAEGWGAMKYPQLTLGMIAIFVYVGVEVAIGSNLGEFLKQPEFGGFEASEITPFVAMFWGSLMIGRWVGAVNVFPVTTRQKNILKFVVPFVAFGVIMGATSLAGYETAALKWYFICILVQIAAFFLTKDKPALTLSVFSCLGVLSIIIALNTTGLVAVYALLSCGLSCSIMWPCIFSLATAGLGKYTTQGAAFLVMMILGGAIIPPIQGKLADLESVGIQNSFAIGALCFAYLIFYAFNAKKSLNKQGLTFE